VQPGPACYDVTYENGASRLLPHVDFVMAASGLLAVESRVRAHGGDAHGAAEAIRAIFAAARSLEYDPTLPTQQVRMVCDQYGRKQLRRLLSAGVKFSDADLADCQRDLRAARYHEGLHRGLLGERVVGLIAFEDPTTLGATGVKGVTWRVWGQDDQVRYLNVMRRLTAASELPWPEAVAAARGIQREIRDLVNVGRNRQHALLGSLRPPAWIWGAFGGSAKAFDVGAVNTAVNRAADAAIAVERFRRRHGRLPKRLDELVPDLLPAVPKDPFTGDPLHYAAGGGFYLVYSVGPDGKDNGGTGDDTTPPTFPIGAPDRTGPDLVFRVGVATR
jgi:hypothetical protein